MAFSALNYDVYYRMHKPILSLFPFKLYQFFSHVRVLSKKPLYWADMLDGDVLYTLGPSHIVNFFMFRNRKIFAVDEFFKGGLKGFLFSAYLSFFKNVLFLSPSPKSWAFFSKFNAVKAYPMLDVDLIEGERSFVLWIGRPEPNKGFDIFLYLAKHFSNEKFVAIGFDVERFGPFVRGDVSYKNSFFRLPKNVEVYGRLPWEKVKEFYRKAKVLVVSSFSESVGFTVAEALAFDVPVIVFKQHPFSPILLEEWRVDRYSKKAFLDKLRLMLKEDWKNVARDIAVREGIVDGKERRERLKVIKEWVET